MWTSPNSKLWVPPPFPSTSPNSPTLADDDKTANLRRGSRSVRGWSSDRSATRRCYSVGGEPAYGGDAVFGLRGAVRKGDANWSSDVSKSEAKHSRDGGSGENVGIGFGVQEAMERLPSDIVQNILCGMETKDAVKCSLVGKRWRFLWQSLPVLDVDTHSFPSYFTFANFLTKVLRVRSQNHTPLTRCKLNVHVPLPIQHFPQTINVRNVILHAIDHGIQHFSLSFPGRVDELPKLFSCHTLSWLQLHELDILPTYLDLFSPLTTLHLVRCSFGEDNDYFKPFRHFDRLRDLLISDCQIPSKTLDISLPNLTNLTISKMYYRRNVRFPCKILISCQKMTSLDVIDSHISQFSYALPLSIQTAELVDGNNHLIDLTIEDAKVVTLSLKL